jgi:hypothetical protein
MEEKDITLRVALEDLDKAHLILEDMVSDFKRFSDDLEEVKRLVFLAKSSLKEKVVG